MWLLTLLFKTSSTPYVCKIWYNATSGEASPTDSGSLQTA